MSSERAVMAPVLGGWRAFFAPVDHSKGTPAVFDPAQAGLFDSDVPPAPWVEAGVIANLKRTPLTKVTQLRGGKEGGTSTQCRTAIDARVEFDFRDWGKVQMSIAGGGEHMNVLASTLGPTPSGGTPVPAINVLAGSTATNIIVGADIVATFNVGDLIAIDIDYGGQTGYVGTGIPAAYVRSEDGLAVDYIRRVTLNVERVAAKTETTLVLARPLIGGVPAQGAKLQLVTGFVDREGASFFQEWSAVFISKTLSGGRICFYYPRMQSCAPGNESSFELTEPLRAMMLHASLIALPFADSNDGQQSVCWRSYIPAPNAAAY